MAKRIPELIICFIFFSTLGILFFLTKCFVSLEILQNIGPEYSWMVHCVTNILGYSTIIIPGYLVFRYVRKTGYLDRAVSGLFPTIIRKLFGEEELIDKANAVPTSPQYSLYKEALLLVFYFCGLQASYLCWGVLQEKIMTQKYVNKENEEGFFKDSQFLVLVNRVLAFGFSGIYICCRRQPRHKCPMYKYIFCSISNIMSSWCQYEALKYVSFLHQVLAKAAKTIPVMVMGKIVSRTKYECYEYITAIILSVGMLFFMVDTGNDNGSTITTFAGIILLCSYIAFDSFTSNWQGALFKQFSMSPVQMMCAINFFSCIFTSTSLLQKGGFEESINFMLKFPSFIIDCFLLSLCSATGQLLIFSTVATFGPLVFTIISTIRQGFSVLLSCLLYNHKVNALGVFGIVLVFVSMFLRTYCSYRLKTIRNRRANEPLKHINRVINKFRTTRSVDRRTDGGRPEKLTDEVVGNIRASVQRSLINQFPEECKEQVLSMLYPLKCKTCEEIPAESFKIRVMQHGVMTWLMFRFPGKEEGLNSVCFTSRTYTTKCC